MPRRQKLSQNFHWKVLSNFRMVFDVSLETQSDSKNYVSVQDDEITELVQIDNHFYNRLAISNKHHIFSSGSKEAFCSNSLNISNCRCKHKFFKCQAHANFIVYTSSVISPYCTLTQFLESLSISKETSNTINKFERNFQWKFCENFWLPGI